MPSTETEYSVPTPGIIEVPSALLDHHMSSDAIALYLAIADSWRPGAAPLTMGDIIMRLSWTRARFMDALRELEAEDIVRVSFGAGGWAGR